ncbi:hypothetical protein UPYG_G00173750 [Umbra pygmaea]|uniref:TANK-binding kinase 1 coiled-coil domain-containing protein n=1 Tax=Umbra pygmaea TaxID=75934 RepID=A0ABD0WTV7_UMBPY
MKQLLYNDEQIHKFEKIHLSSYIKRVKALLREECLHVYRDLLASASTWSSALHEMQCRLSDFGHFSRGLMGDLEICVEQQNKVLDRVLLRTPVGLSEPGCPEATDTPREKERMVLRLHRLKEEMEIVVRELQCNNNLIESLGTGNSATTLEDDVPRPIGL